MKFKIFGRTFEIKNSTSSMPPPGFEEGWRAYLMGKGYNVTALTAVKVAAVIRCVDVVAKTMASLPLNLLRSTENGREKADDHRLYKMLYRLPNPHTTAYEFWHMYVFNLMLTRGAYAEITRDRNGFITGLQNIPTANVSKFFNTVNGERFIDVFLSEGRSRRLREGEFMYTPGLRLNSDIDPENPVHIAADVLGLTMALNGYAKDYFENGSNLGGFIESENPLDDKSYQRFKESWQATYAGVTNQHKIGFLENGMKFNAMAQKPNDSQALESRKFEIIEICRMFGVPPHLVYDLERATFSNIEQQNIEFHQQSITPMAVRLEQTVYKDLLTTKEQETYYAKFNVNALLRGDTASRTAYYNVMRQNGVLSANDIRELEDMNMILEENGGNAYLVNGNMISLKNAESNLPKSLQKAGGA